MHYIHYTYILQTVWLLNINKEIKMYKTRTIVSKEFICFIEIIKKLVGTLKNVIFYRSSQFLKYLLLFSTVT